jgi:hypothetical protein
MQSREETAKRSPIDTRINFEKKSELKFSSNSQDSKHWKNLNGINFTLIPSVFTEIETLIHRLGLIKNYRSDPLPCPDQKAGCNLFAHHSLFCHLNSMHPAAVRLHRPENETVKGPKLVREPRRDE